MKKILSALVCALILLSLLLPATAVLADEVTLVNDLENLLTDEEEQELEEILSEVGEKYSMTVAVLTTPSLNGKSDKDFADDFWDENGLGDDGVMFMVSFAERYWYISTAGEAQWKLSNRDIDEIAEEVLEYIGEEEFYEGFKEFADECDYYLSLDNTYETYYEDEYSGYYEYEKPAFNWSKTLIFALIIGFFVGWIIAASQKSKLRSVAMQTQADDYIKNGSFELTGKQDVFLFSNVSRTPVIRSNDDMGGGHSGSSSSVHMSSGGVSHGGHGGRF